MEKRNSAANAPAGNTPSQPVKERDRSSATKRELKRNSSLIGRTPLQVFLDLVNCRPEEVKDIPPDRMLPTEELKAECARIDPEAQRRSLGEMEVYFGKHRGKKLKDVPLDYLRWVLSEPAQTKSFRKFQRKVREFLGPVAGGAP